MTKEEIKAEALRVGRQVDLPTCASDQAYRGVNSVFGIAFVAGAEWMQEQMIKTACEWLKRELAEPMPEDLYQQWCEEKLADFRKELTN